MKGDLAVFGHWAFVIGLLIAVLAGFAEIPGLAVILFVLGLVVGFLNIGEKESTPFLIAVTALLVIGVAGLQAGQFTPLLVSILNNFLAFVAAAGLVVAIKQVLAVAKPTEKPVE
jgi:hypothetical protein